MRGYSMNHTYLLFEILCDFEELDVFRALVISESPPLHKDPPLIL